METHMTPGKVYGLGRERSFYSYFSPGNSGKCTFSGSIFLLLIEVQNIRFYGLKRILGMGVKNVD